MKRFLFAFLMLTVIAAGAFAFTPPGRSGPGMSVDEAIIYAADVISTVAVFDYAIRAGVIDVRASAVDVNSTMISTYANPYTPISAPEVAVLPVNSKTAQTIRVVRFEHDNWERPGKFGHESAAGMYVPRC